MYIQTKRLRLEPTGMKYLNSTHSYAGDKENVKFMVYLPDDDIYETQRFLRQVEAEWEKTEPLFYEFAILLEDEHIGGIGIDVNRNDKECELGWILSKHHWGNQYTLEAAKGVIQFAMEHLDINKFIAHCDSENVNSYRVMEKLGMQFVQKTPGRKNKSSSEEREESTYLLVMESPEKVAQIHL
jgi:Acetyltransferases, including N-acetylases of ribosomal proteins